MAITIHDPKYGYRNDPNDVHLPCHVVGMVTAADGESVIGIGYQVDTLGVQNITFPPSLEFGIPFFNPAVAMGVPHLLTIVVFDDTSGFTSASFTFTPTGVATFTLEKVTPLAFVPPAKSPHPASARHRIGLNRRSKTVKEGTATRTFELNVTPEDAKSVSVAVLPPFELFGSAAPDHRGRYYSATTPAARTAVTLTHPDQPRDYAVTVLAWDPTKLARGVNIEEVVAQRVFQFRNSPGKEE